MGYSGPWTIISANMHISNCKGAGAFSNVVGPVTCVAVASVTSCSVNLVAQPAFTIGSGSITMTTTCSGSTSLPSTPFAYVVVIVPIPANVRIK